MALILELVDARGVRRWHRLDALPLTLGRALTSDVILDDPYADARHARLAMDETGALLLEDQGSVNGLRAGAAGGERLDARVPVRAGMEVRLGRTMLRFHDADAAVPPALVDDMWAPAGTTTPVATVSAPVADAGSAGAVGAVGAVTSPPRGRGALVRRWLATTPGHVATVAASAAVFAMLTWLTNTDRSAGNAIFTAVLGFLLLAAFSAGLWSVASRIVVHRFRFAAHLAVISVAVLAVMAFGNVDSWLTFLFPDTKVLPVLSMVLGLALLAVLVATHLALATTLPRNRTWRIGLAVAGIVVALAGISALTDDDDAFSDVPEFSGIVKPLAPRYIPTKSVDDFARVMQELKEDVDEIAKEKRTTLDIAPLDTVALPAVLEQVAPDSAAGRQPTR